MSGDAASRRLRSIEAQRLTEVTAAVYRALASTPNRLARHAADADRAGWQMLLSESPRDLQAAPLARWRGRVDALAMRARYSDEYQHQLERPRAQPAQMLFSLLEQNRVELLGSRRLAGVHDNLCALLQEKWLRARPEGVVRAADAAWIETVALLARVPLGAPLPNGALQSLRHRWRYWLTSEQVREIEALSAHAHDQGAYARQALRVVDAVLGKQAAPERERSSEPEVDELADASSTPSQDAPRSASGDPLAAMDLRRAGDEAAPLAPAPAPLQERPYAVYTRSFDQLTSAAELADAERLLQLRRELDQRLGRQLSGIARWAHRLQRRLLALQLRSWEFDRDEGVLDDGRLTRLVTHPLEPLAYKQESEIAFPDTVVTLLVDNSGSMRGTPIATAAICAELLGRVLERCNVKSEILGFTTVSWRGGRARQQWAAAGRPAHPGRLTELRHIVYKDADEPWRRARARLGLMLDPDLLKENVDGEALLWAHARLLARPERRRILLVISDGAPLDEATIAANDALYLESHLRCVIDRIQDQSPVELAAVGIGHDVTRHYRRAVTLPSAADLGEALVQQLLELFDAGGMS